MSDNIIKCEGGPSNIFLRRGSQTKKKLGTTALKH